MKRKFVLTDKVEDLNGTGYASGREENPSSIHANNAPNDAMQENFLKNCAETGLILFEDYGL